MVTPLRTILSAGLLAGVLDGIAAAAQAYLMRGMNPVVVFQYVARGALGRNAFDSGWLTAGLGIVFHLAIAFSWAALFFFAYPSLSFLDSSSTNAVNFSSARTTKRFPSSRCASATKIVRPLESIAETQPQLQPALLRIVGAQS